ncbi:MAG: hypothetical protein K2X93_04705 [Candidatus Obscuribacterales bacterium]|nr:hypothetical protein [Candidatus Obscuribacterales bacterium]
MIGCKILSARPTYLRYSQSCMIAALIASQLFLVQDSIASDKEDHHGNPHLKKGITLFKVGSYKDAVGEFGMALSTDFDNSVLHYYLANTWVNLKQREAAIREFRIAYALTPKKDAGILSKQALAYMGADNYDDGVAKQPIEKPKMEEKVPTPEPVDPIFEKTLQMLKRQAEDLGLDRKVMSPEEQEWNRILDEQLKRSKNSLVESLLRADPEEVRLPADAMEGLLRVRRLSNERLKGSMSTMQRSGAIKDSAESLHTLLHEKDSRSAPRLVPHGTSLYIRNYKNP